jgi:RNA polymerase sigma-70 factor (ECF subfamily)
MPTTVHKNSKEISFEREAMAHTSALFGMALKLTGNERDAEDLVQETYLKAYQAFEQYTLGSNCKAWLFAILRNTFINDCRKRKRQQTLLAEDLTPSPFLTTAAPASASAVTGFNFSQQLSDEVSQALETVPRDFRRAVVLVDLMAHSYKEAALQLDCPVGTVMSRLYRGRRLLREQLNGFAREYGLLMTATQ